MCQIIEQVSSDMGIAVEDATRIFSLFSAFLVSKIPELRQVVNDVFEDVEADILSQHIKKLVSLLEKQSMGNFNTWTMPEQPESVRKSFNDLIL
jgi:hypothetical protein